MTDYGRMDPYSFVGSKDIDQLVRIRIISLDGEEPPLKASTLLERPDLRYVGSNSSPHSDLQVTVQAWAGSKPLTVPVQTAYKAFRTERKWNEWLQLPIKYKDLPSDACLAITVWDLSPAAGPNAVDHSIPFGGTTLAMFDDENQVQKGRQKCHIYRHRSADPTSATSTPALLSPKRTRRKGEAVPKDKDKDAEELERMERLFKKLELGEIARVDWLDQMVFRNFEKRGLQAAKLSMKLRQREHALHGDPASAMRDGEEAGSPKSLPTLLLNVELLRFDLPVVFADHEYDPPPISSLQHLSASQAALAQRRPQVQYGPGIDGSGEGSEPMFGRLVKVYDPEVGQRDNPAEGKHRRLFRSSHRHEILDRDLKPNSKVRDELDQIISYPPTQALSPDETDLVWKFRWHLTRDKRALTKFVKSVSWDNQSESKQAVQVLERWTEIEVDDALELLGPSFGNPAVRSYAVDRLRKADDDELLLYLLQLVQALKYEHISTESSQESTEDSSLARFLIQRAAASFKLGNYFHWYLMVECDDHSPEQGVVDNRSVYRKVAYDFMTELVKRPDGVEARKTLLRQAEMLAILSKIATEVRFSNESIAKKTERAKQFIQDAKNELMTIEPPLAMPLDPSVQVVGIAPEQTTVFKSSLSPIKFTFKTLHGNAYPIVYKVGDDLRQDQLVIQIIRLMDQLLRNENLDLMLSPYQILATSPSAGASQFVQSQNFSSIVSKFKNNPVLAYLRHHNPDATQPGGVRQETLDTYVRSCAGYCVITYILGVGDRHLENLLLAPDGHFFHTDFGYILGRDPKPFAPAMKLTKEMVDCMGGVSSKHYQDFRQYCFMAFAALRKSSNLILNLFSLMVDANIPHIKSDPDKALLIVRERFHLELSEEEAIVLFDRIIEDNLAAIGAALIDMLHGLRQALRA